MFDQSHPNNGGRLGKSMNYLKGTDLYAHNIANQNDVNNGFEQRITLDKGMDEVTASSVLGHESFVHADKDADKLTQINKDIKSGKYKDNVQKLIDDLYGVVSSGDSDHKDLKDGKATKYKNYSDELAKKKKDETYKDKYEDDKKSY